MVRNILLKILLFPFSIIYGFFSWLYNLTYDSNVLESIKFSLPVISVGNLTVGGTGKTPHIEYLVNFLKPYLQIATLSRGYKRKTKGFRKVELSDDIKAVGDEPLLYKRKYHDVNVYVAESRLEGISNIVMDAPDVQTILLDDAYQHREITPAINILLTEFDFPFYKDFYLPTGRLREWRSGYKRADIIIVTKCPDEVSEAQKSELIEKINLRKNQKIFFSYYRYFNPYYIYNPEQRIRLDKNMTVLLISALASTSYLLNHLEDKIEDLHSLEFTDHHNFTFDEVVNFKRIFDELGNTNKIILTTEKDAMRLDIHRQYILENKLPIFVLPVAVDFLFDEKKIFDETIKNMLLEFKS